MATETKHTPGPWHVKPDRKAFTIHIRSDEEYILTIQGMNEVNKANACLIAAAPELLSALKEMIDWCVWDTDYVARAKAAIVKAEGGK